MPYRFMRFPGGKAKAVTFSYDDGAPSDAKMMEIFNHYGMKCTLNLNGERLRREEGLKIAQVQEYLSQGHEVAVHGAEHLALGLLSPLDGIREALRGREMLEQTLDRIIRGMAYADSGLRKMAQGTDYESIRKYLVQLGITYARTLGGDNNDFEMPSDWYAWMPSAHHDNPNLPADIQAFLAIDPNEGYRARRYPRLLYIWGHSFEFDRNQNWDRLDEICAPLAGKEDIWYATNGEIREYAAGYEALIRSADGRKVYNPNLFPIWFVCDENQYCVQSGEMLRL
ncbi:MAG: polysaccharide deacetylase [Clostridiales bacterium]|nr:polysaccharide deacetylase [Clostridiales bacterium]